MKHAPLEDEMTKILNFQGLKTFDPYSVNAESTKKALGLLHSTNGTSEALLLDTVVTRFQPTKQCTEYEQPQGKMTGFWHNA